MLKIMLCLCLFIALMVVWNVWFKMYRHQRFRSSKNSRTHKPIQATSDLELEQAPDSQCNHQEAEEYEQQLFDDVCQIFFEQSCSEQHLNAAVAVQADVLRKMPAKAQTQIRKLDLDEWSIYWSFYQQSLEYYVGRYGIFYTHVDRFGQEHKFDLKIKKGRF